MSEQVHIRVGKSRHQKWVSHAEAEYDGNMSKLIRAAAEKEISGVSDGGSPSDGAEAVAANGRIDDILNGVEDNGSALEATQDRLENMHDTMLSQGGLPDKVFSDVYGHLPVVKDGFEDADKDAIAIEFGATAAEIAEKAGVSEFEAERALVQQRQERGVTTIILFRPLMRARVRHGRAR